MVHLFIDTNAIAVFCRQHSLRELALFGSVTREDFRPDSDVDVLIEFEPNGEVGLLGYCQMIEELEALFKRSVDLVTKESLSPHFRDTVLANRQVLYDHA